MSATHDRDRTTSAAAPLYLAFELGWTSWGLAFSTAPALPPRRVTIPARDTGSLRREIDRARRRFGLPADAPVRCNARLDTMPGASRAEDVSR